MFESYISLGRNCQVATVLESHGYRSTSGPFDWCTSFDFVGGIIPLLECSLSDFLSYENLKPSKEDKQVFDDVKYKINYNHDIKECFEQEYQTVYEKYQRRVKRFLEMVRKPTCFIRLCWSANELSAIAENEERIQRAIAFHPANEIIFVVPKYVYKQNPIKSAFQIFLVDSYISGFELNDLEEVKSSFDSNPELLEFLKDNYDPEKREKNIAFYLQSKSDNPQKKDVSPECKKLQKQVDFLREKLKDRAKSCIELESRLARWERITNTDYSTISYPDKVSIYGCGAIGRTFYQHIRDRVNVIEFIDRTPRQDFYDSVPVVTCENAKSDGETQIIIVPSYAYDEIVRDLTDALGFEPNAVGLEEFLAEGKVLDPNF